MVRMKIVVLIGAAVALCVGVAVFALHFELDARTQAYHELTELRGQTRTDLDRHRITPGRATAEERRLHQASIELDQNNVRGAQQLLDGVKAALAAHSRAA